MKITEEVYALDVTRGSYAYVIIDSPVILIDSSRPGQGKAILKELAAMNIRPGDVKHILLTHYDVDHTGSATYLQRETGATIWASQIEIPYILGEKPLHGIKKWAAMIMPAEKPQRIQAYPPDGKVERVTAIASPGHTPGHVCLLYKDVLFAGDLVVGDNGRLKESMRFMAWDMDVLRESIKNLAPWSFRWICPAHGTPLERRDQWEKLS